VAKRFEYQFEWDPSKARQNLKEHRISFERAATVFLDPLALSQIDEEHSRAERRWITLALDRTGALLVVSHTYLEETELSARIRLISRAARRNMRLNNMRGGRETMKREYDFSKAVRGKFYRKGAELRLPIYLDVKLQKQLERLAEKNGKNVNDLVNQFVQREVELIEEFS
jgi:uncharacterized DUF497 family protein